MPASPFTAAWYSGVVPAESAVSAGAHLSEVAHQCGVDETPGQFLSPPSVHDRRA
jgi:hypothetical protein